MSEEFNPLIIEMEAEEFKPLSVNLTKRRKINNHTSLCFIDFSTTHIYSAGTFILREQMFQPRR